MAPSCRSRATRTTATPEELRWQASAYAPSKIRKRLRFAYWLIGIEAGLAIAHLLVSILGNRPMPWTILIVLLAGIIQLANSIRNGRRILRSRNDTLTNQGQRP